MNFGGRKNERKKRLERGEEIAWQGPGVGGPGVPWGLGHAVPSAGLLTSFDLGAEPHLEPTGGG